MFVCEIRSTGAELRQNLTYHHIKIFPMEKGDGRAPAPLDKASTWINSRGTDRKICYTYFHSGFLTPETQNVALLLYNKRTVPLVSFGELAN